MLEHVPQWLGALLRNVRAGHAKLAIVNHDLRVGTESLELASRPSPMARACPNASPPMARACRRRSCGAIRRRGRAASR